MCTRIASLCRSQAGVSPLPLSAATVAAPRQQRRPLGSTAAASSRHGAAQEADLPTLAAVAAALGSALWAPAALAAAEAAESVPYNPAGGEETVKLVVGVAYLAAVGVYFIWLFRRRAQKATSERIASVADASAYGASAGADDSSDEEDEEEQKAKQQVAAQEVTPLQCFVGAAQAGAIAYGLFLASSSVDTYFDRQQLPDITTQYTAHNIAVLVQTVCRGLVYLCTFIFGANALGLAGLGVQVLIDPAYGRDDGSGRRKRAPALPRVSVTDNVFELRKAFQEAERLGKADAEKEIRKSRASADDD